MNSKTERTEASAEVSIETALEGVIVGILSEPTMWDDHLSTLPRLIESLERVKSMKSKSFVGGGTGTVNLANLAGEKMEVYEDLKPQRLSTRDYARPLDS